MGDGTGPRWSAVRNGTGRRNDTPILSQDVAVHISGPLQVRGVSDTSSLLIQDICWPNRLSIRSWAAIHGAAC